MTVEVTTAKLITTISNVAGTGYDIADTITCAGGTFSTAAIVDVATTKLGAVPTIFAAGTGGTPARSPRRTG